MGMVIVIKAKIPDHVSEVYQDQYVLRQLRDALVDERIELPHPEANLDLKMKVDVESININWVRD